MAARRGKSQARRTTSNGTPGWVWLVAGAAIAAVVFLAAPNLFKKDDDGFLRPGPRANPDAEPAPVADADVDTAIEASKPDASGKVQAKPSPAQTQYDFYTMLPGKEVRMSDAELAATARAEEAARARAALEGKPVPAARAPVSTSTAAPTPIAENSPAPRPLTEPAVTRPAPVNSVTATAPAVASSAAAAAAPAKAPAAPTAPVSPPTPVASHAEPTAATAAPADNHRYILQAGSFGASGDAESTKAKLAMLGLSARVESADINGKTVYRVRMGPYRTASELAEAKQKLSGSGLPAIAIKAQ
jgi:cell division protein FtsN